MEKPDLVAAPDEDENHFLVQEKGGPDRDTMTPIKSPARVSTLSTPGIIFFGKGWPTPKAHATGPLCGPVSGSPSSRPDRCCVPVLLGRPDLPGPARCSRDTAKVAVFRLASSHPRPETSPVVILMTARPFQGREERSGRRVVAAVARTSTASGCEGNEPHQR